MYGTYSLVPEAEIIEQLLGIRLLLVSTFINILQFFWQENIF
jgi:hypothetical protein